MNNTALKARNALFKAFIINYAAVIALWLVSMTDFYPRAINILYPAGGINAASFMLNAIGYWKISAVVLFLIPAIAIHWEYAPKKKRR